MSASRSSNPCATALCQDKGQAETAVQSGRSHPALHITELLNIIFKSLSTLDLSHVARVCHVWSDVALDALWREPEDLHALFAILAPLQLVQSKHVFARFPSVADWKRFDKYAFRVRKLVFRPTENTPSIKHLSKAVYQDIALSRPRSVIFPNMHTLGWTPDDATACASEFEATDAAIFMHPQLQSLRLNLTQSQYISTRLCEFVEDIASRCPNLTDLHLHDVPDGFLEDSLCHLASAALKLKSLSLPPCCLTTKLVESLSSLPVLEAIRINEHFHSADLSEPTNVLLQPMLRRGSFPALQTLSTVADFRQFDIFLGSIDTLSSLCTLGVFSAEIEQPEAYQSLLNRLSTSYPRIQQIALSSSQDPSTVTSEEDNTRRITFNHLHPLTKFPSLFVLHIEHAHPLKLSMAELQTLLSSLPTLRELILNPAPVHDIDSNSSEFGLDVLGIVARYCKHIHTFGTFVDATKSILAQPTKVDLPPMPNLELLSVGISKISKQAVVPVARYLSAMIPDSCDFAIGVPWESRGDEDTEWFYDEVDARMTLWEEVRDLTRAFIEVRWEERRNTMNLLFPSR